MKTKSILLAGGLLLALVGSGVQALEFPVQGTGASGRAGDRVFVNLIFDYGPSFGVIAEDLQFEYKFAGITFVPDASTIDVSGAPQNLLQFAGTLQPFAQLHGGNVLVNLNPVPTLGPDYKGYALSFFTADGTPQLRSGKVHLSVAFEVLANALPGQYKVSFTDKNALSDDLGNEYSYPVALQNLSVTVAAVPEPQLAVLLLPGLVVVGLYARRRAGRRQ